MTKKEMKNKEGYTLLLEKVVSKMSIIKQNWPTLVKGVGSVDKEYDKLKKKQDVDQRR